MKITTTKNREEGKEQIHAFPCLPGPGSPKFLRTLFFFVLGGLFVLLPSSWAQVPQVPSTMTYQGRILQNGTPFSGKGRFMFVIYAGETLTWNNLQGTTNPTKPTASSGDWLELEVRNGVFSVVLGKGVNKNEALNLPVFFDSVRGPGVRENLRMEVWFSPGADTPPRKLSPDIEFASVPFAQVAQLAMTALNSTNASKLGGFDWSSILVAGGTNPATGFVMGSRIETGGVSSLQIADGTINISDIAAAAAAQLMPPGGVIAYGGTNEPTGWLLCDGRAVSRTNYPALFAAIRTNHGAGDGSNTFHLPDYRGRFLRGVSGATNNDPDRDTRTNLFSGGAIGNNVGSYQADEFKSHRHTISKGSVETGGGRDAGGYPSIDVTSLTTDVATDAITVSGGSETRPRNVYVNYLIKY